MTVNDSETSDDSASTNKFVDLLVDCRYVFLLVAGLIGGWAWFGGRELKIERRLESMFQPNDPALRDYKALQSRFGGNEVVLLVYQDEKFWRGHELESTNEAEPRERPGETRKPAVRAPAARAARLDGDSPLWGPARLKTLHDALCKIDGIQSVMDLSVVDDLIRRSDPKVSSLLGSSDEQGVFSRSEPAVAFRELFAGYTHSSSDGSWLSVACLLNPESPRPRAEIMDAVKASAKAAGIETSYLVGEPVMIREGFDMIESDGTRLGWTSAVVLFSLMLLFYRSILWTTVTLIVIQWSLAVTRWCCVLAAWELTMISSMLVAIVTVIGIATTMHWLHHFQADYFEGRSRTEAVRSSLKSVIQPLTWACVTDAIAFAALLIARVEPIRDYGAMMCVASLVTLVGVVFLGPGLVLLLDDCRVLQRFGASFSLSRAAQAAGRRPENDPEPSDRLRGSAIVFGSVSSRLRRVLELGVALRRTAIVSFLLALVLVLVGTPLLTIETDFLQNFRPDSKLVEGYRIVERRLAGAGVWDAVIPAPMRLSDEYLKQVSQLEDRLKNLPAGGPTKVISLAGAEAVSRRSPWLSLIPLELRLSGMRALMPDFFDSMLEAEPRDGLRGLRIMLRAQEAMSTTQKQRLIASVRREIETAVHQPAFLDCFPEAQRKRLPEHEPIVTGYYVLLPKLVESVIADQWLCLGVAMLGIGAVLWLAIGDVKLAFIALIANTLPSLACVACLGILAIPINLGVVMIAAVSLGLSVDSSLHYFIDYQRRRRKGQSSDDALLHTQGQIGTPILCSSLSLILGFLSLCTSDFLPTVWFGGMAALSIILGLFANLLWLPVFTKLVEPLSVARLDRR